MSLASLTATPFAQPAAQALRSLSVASGWSLTNCAGNSSWQRSEKGEEPVSAISATSRPPLTSALPARCPRGPGRLTSTVAGWAASPLWPHGSRSFAAQAGPQSESKQQAAPSSAEREGGAEARQAPTDRTARPPNDVVYMGPLSQQHKLLKRISITNTLVAIGAAPAIVAFADNISMISRYGLATSLVFFGLITTGALHWVAHPYVHELRYTASTGQIEARTTTLLGSSRWHTFNVDDVQPLPWNRPVATFTALGQFYYIDVYSFPDEALLRRLTPDAEDVPQGYKDKDKDEDDD